MAASFISAEQLNGEIGKGNYRPVYYFFGEEEYRKAEAIKFILKDYIPEQQQVLNFTRLSVDKNDFESICSELAAIPMLGERRLIIIEEAQKLIPTQQRKLFDLLKLPIPETIIILSSPAAHTPRKTSAFYKAVTGVARAVQFSRLSENSAAQRIHRQLKAAELDIDPEAVRMLILMVDGDSGGLVGELEKLALMAGPGARIGTDEVMKLASSYEDFNIFELIDAIAEGKTDRALRAYHDLILRGNRPTSLMWQLSNHILNLLKIHTGKRVIGAPFFISKLRDQSRVFRVEKALMAIEYIAGVERDIRHSSVEPAVLIENVIRKISR